MKVLKRIVCLMMALMMVWTIMPPIEAEAATTPQIVCTGDAQTRINELVEKFNNKYFTVTGERCTEGNLFNHDCDNCWVSYVLGSASMQNLIGMGVVNPGLLPYFRTSQTGKMVLGWSCVGFANFAQWYIYAQRNTDNIVGQYIAEGYFNADTMSKAIPGDVIWLKHYNHAVIFIDSDKNGITVLACNSDAASDGNCLVKKHRVEYKKHAYDWATISGTTNDARHHTHEWDELGYCTADDCPTKNKDYLNTSQGALQTKKGTAANSTFSYVYVKERPYQKSDNVAKVKAVQVLGYVNNHYSNRWNKVHFDSGTSSGEGYVFSGDVKFTPAPSDISVSADVPNITKGTSLWAYKGQYSFGAKSNSAALTSISCVICNANGAELGYGKISKSIRGNSFSSVSGIGTSEDVLKFSKLPVGAYALKVTATDDNGHTKTLQAAFTVGNASLPVRTVTYYANGGSGVSAASKVKAGTTVQLSTVKQPVRSGYNFLGWADAPDAEAPDYLPNEDIVPGSDMSLYAVWEAIAPPETPVLTMRGTIIGAGKAIQLSWNEASRADLYTVSAFSSDSQEYSTQTVKSVLTSMKFDDAGIYTVRVKASNDAGDSAFSDPIEVDVRAPSTVTFVDHNGTVLSAPRVAYGETAVPPVSQNREGYEFSGWSGTYSNVTADTTVTAQYTPIRYTVTFMDAKGSVAKQETVTYSGDEPGGATPPEESELNIDPGYVLAGWSTNEYLRVTRDITVVPAAVWGNQDVPIDVNVDSVTEAGEGYWINYTLTNRGFEEEMGRIVVVLKSNFGKFLTKTESGAFYLPGTQSGSLSVEEYEQDAQAEEPVILEEEPVTAGEEPTEAEEGPAASTDEDASETDEGVTETEEIPPVDEGTVDDEEDADSDREDQEIPAATENYADGVVLDWVDAATGIRISAYDDVFTVASMGGSDDPSYSGEIYVPLSAVPEGEMFTTVEVYVVSNFETLTPISEPCAHNVITSDGDWSYWMTDAELAEFGAAYTDVQTKTQYSRREKSTHSANTPTYLDWTLSGTSTGKGDWGNWGGWQDTPIAANENVEVQTQNVVVTAAYTMYKYGKYVGPSDGYANWSHFHQGNYKNGCRIVETGWNRTRGTLIETDAWEWASNNSAGTGKYKNGKYNWNQYTVNWATSAYSKTYYWEQTKTVPAVTKTQYRCRTRSDVTVYNFYKWSDWSDWSDTASTSGALTEVKTRTMHRVLLAEAPAQGAYSIDVNLSNIADTGKKQAILTVYKVDEASDYSIEYMEQVTLDPQLNPGGNYNFSFYTLEEPSIATGDFTITLTLEGADSAMYVGTIAAPKPQYNVEFVDETTGNRIGGVQTVEEGGNVQAPDIPQKEGYTFVGWDYGLNNIRDNMIIKARYIPENYTVVFVDWANHSVTLMTDAPYGSKLELPEVEAIEGYNFLGWSAPEGFDLDCVTGSMVVNANYEHFTYTVRFMDANGNVFDEQTVGHGDKVTIPESGPEVPENMFFVGWDDAAYDGITASEDFYPDIEYIDFVSHPQASIESGCYEGPQMLTISCDEENSTITYRILAADGEEGGGEEHYTGAIAIDRSMTIEVTAYAENKNASSAVLEYVILPENSTPDSPASVTLTQSTESIQLSWAAADGAAGYLIDKTDMYGIKESLISETAGYTDTNVEGVNIYTYSVSSFALVGEAETESYLYSDTCSPEVSITFYGECKPIDSIEINAPDTVELGSSVALSASVAPTDAFNQDVLWSIQPGTGSGTISANGILTATTAGTVTVMAAATDGSRVTADAEIEFVVSGDAVGLTVSSGTLRRGNTVDVSVNIDPNSDVSLIQFALLYDESAVKLESCEAGATIAAMQPTINYSAPGVIYFNWESTTGLAEGGSLLDLTFSANDSFEAKDVVLEIAADSQEFDFVFMKWINDDLQNIKTAVVNGRLSLVNTILGDVNSDDKVNVIDANLIRRYAAVLIRFDESQLSAADVNGDGRVNVIDANYIRRFAAKLITVFPVERV